MKYFSDPDDQSIVRNRLKSITTRFMRTPARKASHALACLGISVSVASGCGILGEKEKKASILSQSDTACLDEIGPLTERFLEGDVDEAHWRSTWDCVDDTIDLFGTYVKGSEHDGYNANDLRFLTQRFLFSKKRVTDGLIRGLLEVKASLFGGSAGRLTNGELAKFRELARFVKEESSALIPHLKNRKNAPTEQNLRAFADAIDGFGERLAAFLNTGNHSKLGIDSAIAFLKELSAVSFEIDPDEIERWTRVLHETKVLIVRGDLDGISGSDWMKLIRFGFRAGGAVIAYTSFEGGSPRFELAMAERIHSTFRESLHSWDGVLPYAQIERIIDQVPESTFPGIAEEFRRGVKGVLNTRTQIINGQPRTFRPALSRFLRSSSDLGIDAKAFDRIDEFYRSGYLANALLDEIYAGRENSLTSAEFESLANRHASSLDAEGKARAQRLIQIAKRYLGYHPAGSARMLFDDLSKHSRDNLSKMSWYELASHTLLEGYGSQQDSYGKTGTLEDLENLVNDVNPILYSMRMVHPLKQSIAEKRFLEANLFTHLANGDDTMNLPEATVYFALLFSSSSLSQKVRDLALLGDHPCARVGWNVPLRQEAYEVECFRNRLVEATPEILSGMPKMRAEYEAMSTADQEGFHQTLESAAKLTGYDDGPVTEYDLSSYAAIPHFVESAFHKFDVNGDGFIDRSEVLKHAFPVFKRKLASISKIKIDFVNKAVLLYLMQHGKQPKVGNLITWALSFQFLKKFHAQRIRVYQIFAALSPPGNPDPISDVPPPGASQKDASTLGFFVSSFVKGVTTHSSADRAPASVSVNFDLSSVDPLQFEGYPADGPIIDPASPYKEALDVLPQDL